MPNRNESLLIFLNEIMTNEHNELQWSALWRQGPLLLTEATGPKVTQHNHLTKQFICVCIYHACSNNICRVEIKSNIGDEWRRKKTIFAKDDFFFSPNGQMSRWEETLVTVKQTQWLRFKSFSLRFHGRKSKRGRGFKDFRSVFVVKVKECIDDAIRIKQFKTKSLQIESSRHVCYEITWLWINYELFEGIGTRREVIYKNHKDRR